jgi:hypothetical protein
MRFVSFLLPPQPNLRLLGLICLSSALSLPSASARLWDSQAELEARYGPPVKRTGYPHDEEYTYAFGSLRIEVQFYDGISHQEVYSHEDPRLPLGQAEIEQILADNANGAQWRIKREPDCDGVVKPGATSDWEIDGPNGRAYAAYSSDFTSRFHLFTQDVSKNALDPNFRSTPPRTNKDLTLTGTITLQDDPDMSAIFRSANLVIVIPWYPKQIRPVSGRSYNLTFRDQEPIDSNEVVAYLSDREHKDFDALLRDSVRQLLIRIEDGNKIIFDRSVCEVHHLKMVEKMVNVDYGLYATSSCATSFPHHRFVILGGCLSSDSSPKKGPLYICPACVVGCHVFKLRWLLAIVFGVLPLVGMTVALVFTRFSRSSRLAPQVSGR